ncbi:MAG: hypothetical protein PVJ05_01925 [Candidatus Thorarchaeota archaeon]|jgi:hypothetical protein
MGLFGYFTWKVDCKGGKPGPEEDFTIMFEDRTLFLEDISKGYLVAQFMNDVLKQFDSQDHYEIIDTIKKITSADDRDLTKVGKIWILLCTHPEMNRIGFLIGYNDTGDVWEVLGLYPEQYARAVKDDARLLHNYLEQIALNPDFWDNVYLIK